MRQSILAIFTIIFVLLSVVFIGFETMEIPKDQNAQIDSILEKLTPEVRVGHINPRTLNTLPPDTFYAIWAQDDDEIWQPLIVNNGVTIRKQDGPTHIPQEFAWAARTYLKTSDNINYIVWINKYNPEFYIKNVIIVALFLLLFYLILVLVISVLFGNKQNEVYEDADNEEEDLFEEEKSSPDENVQLGKENMPAHAAILTEAEKSDNNESSKKSSPDENVQSGTENMPAHAVISTKAEKSDNNESSKKSSPDENVQPGTENMPAHAVISTEAEKSDNNESSEKSSPDENDTVYEHTINGDQPTGVKLTSAEFDALTQPIEYDDEEIDESDPFFTEEQEPPQLPDVPNLPEEAQKRSQAIIDKYHELWQKSIKMSNDFKTNFRFREVNNIQKLGISPAGYIDTVLKIGQNYFEWESSNIYICQDDKLINAVTNEVYEPTIIDIPTKGTKKGLQFVPLFPYGSSELFGYLAYEWNSIKPFRLTDILCYLKIIFDNDTRFIFDDKIQSQIKQIIQKGLDSKGDTLLAVLTIDNKERIRLQYTDDEIAKLDELIFTKIKKNYKKYHTCHITTFKYAIIGTKINKEKSIEAFNKWISNADKHVYPVSPMNNAAVSFSCGIAYKSDTVGSNSTAENMIDRAENLLSVSVNKGGNRISIQQ